ncbi:MAG: acetyl-CoA carboxylase biotin carboxyl carrier protein [Actinobacteria bacterium]|nr:acetyl-CoA carboxylase biotin carboxyl carrier protein [Actinomycetota bacterium]
MRKIKINDITVRDIFQNIDAGFISEKFLYRVIEHISKVKFDSIEVFGGSAFEKILDNPFHKTPFEIAANIKNKMPQANLQALIGARNLVGMEVYSSQIIKKFIKQCTKSGISRYRVFDSLNDLDNFKFVIAEIIDNGCKCQGTIIYDDLEDTDHYIKMSGELLKAGCESICIKDVESTLLPQKVQKLFRELTESINGTFYLSTYNLRGLQVSNYYSACMAGCSGVDLSFIPSSYNDLSPAIFPLLLSFKDTEITTEVNYLNMLELFEWFRANIYPLIKNELLHSRFIISNKNQNLLPKWLLSNINNQLAEIGENKKIDIVLEEVFKIKNEIGNPSLSTPVGQIIGSQAILNTIISDYRWEITNDEIKKLISGYYGKLPREIDLKVLEKTTGEKESLKENYASAINDTGANGDRTFEQCAGEIKNLSDSDADVLSYLFFPEKTISVLNSRKNRPAESPNGTAAASLPGEIVFPEFLDSGQAAKFQDIDLNKLREITNLVETSNVDEIKLEIDGVKVSINKKSASQRIKPEQAAEQKVVSEEKNTAAVTDASGAALQQPGTQNLVNIKAPIVGIFYNAPSPGAKPFVSQGSKVRKGDTLCIIEAMKLMNKINSEVDGEIVQILVTNEEAVEYDQVIMRINPGKEFKNLNV